MIVWHITPEDFERYRIESQEPEGDLVEVTVGDLEICEGMGCYTGMADIHAHITARWSNGAKRREPISAGKDEQRRWLADHRPDLLGDWEEGHGWLWNE